MFCLQHPYRSIVVYPLVIAINADEVTTVWRLFPHLIF